MSKKIKVLAFSGSTRKDSYNKQLLLQAVSFLPKNVELTLIDLRDYPMPLYDGDLEQESKVPENARKIRSLLISADAFIITSPEYNGSISGVLKNTIDWTSRAEDNIPSLAAYKGKYAFILSTSIGKSGGINSLSMLKSILNYMGITVIPELVAIPYATKFFNETKVSLEESDLNLIKTGCQKLISLTSVNV